MHYLASVVFNKDYSTTVIINNYCGAGGNITYKKDIPYYELIEYNMGNSHRLKKYLIEHRVINKDDDIVFHYKGVDFNYEINN